ncbi:MAG: TOBE domain-containing protein [Burkholderiales bacterium]|nr:TOBE domain-containing protein [Burkholderiales bacterium]
MRVDECIYQGSFVRLTGTLADGTRLLAKVDPKAVRDAGDTVAVAAAGSGLVLLED